MILIVDAVAMALWHWAESAPLVFSAAMVIVGLEVAAAIVCLRKFGRLPVNGR